MDIRRWFKSPESSKNANNGHPKSNSKKNKRRIEDSDSEEEIKVSKRKRSADKNKTPESKKLKKQIVSSDDDCDIVMATPPKKPSSKKQMSLVNAVKNQKEKQPVLKHASVADFFSSAPIQRSSKDTKKPTKPLETNHGDEDFLKTLQQLDDCSEIIPEKKQKQIEARKEIVTKKSPTNTKDTKKPTKPLETNHQDEDFLKTLQQLDECSEIIPEKKRKRTEEKKVTVTKKSPAKKKTSKRVPLAVEIVPAPKEAKKKIIVEPEPAKKKPKLSRGGSANYMSYLHREAPKSLGSKEVPDGEVECLRGKSFLMTGILESFERDEIKQLVEDYGGNFMSTLSKRTNYIIIGRDAGPSKLTKAEQFGTTQLDEDGFLDLIRTTPGTGPKKSTTVAKSNNNGEPDDPFEKYRLKQKDVVPETPKENKDASGKSVTAGTKASQKRSPQKEKTMDVLPSSSQAETKIEVSPKVTLTGSQMWVDKYRPNSVKQIIGQQGAESNAKKLSNWICNWDRISQNKRNVGAGRWNTKDDGSGFKAALLSGPPGIGKTTTAQLVCKEAGIDFFELNASDTRSKKTLQSLVSELLLNKSLSNCFSGSSSGKVSKKHVIIMDEVDGMAGNEDRGGVQELISLIKMTKIPIVCICNDRNHTKIRSLSNHCYDLKFQRPRVEQIKAAMMSIAYKEGVKITPEALQNVISGSNQDIRQTLHNLSLWSSNKSGLTGEQAKQDVGKSTKDLKLGPFDVLRDIFSIGMNKNATYNDKSNLFFHDYSIIPLFVHENYVQVMPTRTGGNLLKHLDLLSQAAHSISIGDHIEKLIRSQSCWNMLPNQALFSSVVPGDLLTGHLKQLINFPVWLGKNSNRNHMDRILQELQMHMRTRITGSKTDIALEYLPMLRRSLTNPLIDKGADGVRDVLRIMNHYYLLREDFDNILELSLWSNQEDPKKLIDSKVKAAFTRTYNKESSQNPYAAPSVGKRKNTARDSQDVYADDDYVSESGDSEDEKIENDGMIKMKKPTKTASASSSTSSSKGKASAKSTAKKGKTKK